MSKLKTSNDLISILFSAFLFWLAVASWDGKMYLMSFAFLVVGCGILFMGED